MLLILIFVIATVISVFFLTVATIQGHDGKCGRETTRASSTVRLQTAALKMILMLFKQNDILIIQQFYPNS